MDECQPTGQMENVIIVAGGELHAQVAGLGLG
jgi:hypothetical protein